MKRLQLLLPTKGISAERALLTIAPRIARLMDRPMTTSELWDEFRRSQLRTSEGQRITFDWFTLGVVLLFTIGAVDFDSKGRLRRTDVPS